MLAKLRTQVQLTLAKHLAPAICVDLTRLLGRQGYALHPEGACRAGMLALIAYEAVTHRPPDGRALLAASAVELQMEAAFVFDKVADAEAYPERSEDLALAVALLSAGFAAAADAAADLPDPATPLINATAAYGEACAGQYLDALFQRHGEASLEEALQSTCLKSGGLGRCVAGFAARVCGADEDGTDLLERFGSDAFTLAQLLDDLRDACSGESGSDLEQGKATLPVLFFKQAVGRASTVDAMLSHDQHEMYESSGAPLYVAILAHAYKNRAEEDLSLLARHGYAVDGLARFLKSIDAGAAETLRVVRCGLVA